MTILELGFRRAIPRPSFSITDLIYANTGFVNRNLTVNPRYKLSGFSMKFSDLHVNEKISADCCNKSSQINSPMFDD